LKWFLYFSFCSFRVSGLKVFDPFWIDFVQSDRWGLASVFYMSFQHHLLKRLSFL
jgi:hypothetical protein